MRNYYTNVDCFLELIHLLDHYLKDTILIRVFQENIATLKGLNNCSNQVRTHQQQVSFGIGIGNDCQGARDWWKKRSYIRFDIIDLDSMRLLAGRSSTRPSKFQYFLTPSPQIPYSREYFIRLTFEDAITWKIILGILKARTIAMNWVALVLCRQPEIEAWRRKHSFSIVSTSTIRMVSWVSHNNKVHLENIKTLAYLHLEGEMLGRTWRRLPEWSRSHFAVSLRPHNYRQPGLPNKPGLLSQHPGCWLE